jgi:hypothetical protein
MGREILDLVDEQEVWVDIDAPLRVPPGRTSRRCEREVCAQGIRILPSERGSTSAITGATGVRCYRRSWSGRDCDTSIAGSVHTLRSMPGRSSMRYPHNLHGTRGSWQPRESGRPRLLYVSCENENPGFNYLPGGWPTLLRGSARPTGWMP